MRQKLYIRCWIWRICSPSPYSLEPYPGSPSPYPHLWGS
jgi:hypothetical protein